MIEVRAIKQLKTTDQVDYVQGLTSPKLLSTVIPQPTLIPFFSILQYIFRESLKNVLKRIVSRKRSVYRGQKKVYIQLHALFVLKYIEKTAFSRSDVNINVFVLVGQFLFPKFIKNTHSQSSQGSSALKKQRIVCFRSVEKTICLIQYRGGSKNREQYLEKKGTVNTGSINGF